MFYKKLPANFIKSCRPVLQKVAGQLYKKLPASFTNKYGSYYWKTAGKWRKFFILFNPVRIIKTHASAHRKYPIIFTVTHQWNVQSLLSLTPCSLSTDHKIQGLKYVTKTPQIQTGLNKRGRHHALSVKHLIVYSIKWNVCVSPWYKGPQATILQVRCPDDILQNTDTGQSTALIYWNLPTVLTSTVVGVLRFSSNVQPNTRFQIDVHEVLYTVTDDNNSKGSCSFMVTVTGNIIVLKFNS